MNEGDTGRPGGTTGLGEETWPTVDSLKDSDAGDDLISPARLIRYLDEAGQHRPEHDDDDEEIGDTARVPRITRMPGGVSVDERRVGRAVAQWILHVRCECGRRWFEVEAVDTTTCPRCGVLVYMDVDARSDRR